MIHQGIADQSAEDAQDTGSEEDRQWVTFISKMAGASVADSERTRMTFQEIVSNMITVYLAGTDTTANSLVWAGLDTAVGAWRANPVGPRQLLCHYPFVLGDSKIEISLACSPISTFEGSLESSGSQEQHIQRRDLRIAGVLRCGPSNEGSPTFTMGTGKIWSKA